MNKVKNLILYVLFMCSLVACANEKKLTSPDGNVSATIFSDSQRSLTYKVDFHGNSVINKSMLGIIVDSDTLGKEMTFKEIKKEEVNESYTTRGFHTQAVNHCYQYTYEVASKTGKFILQTRIYNDGFAFRYIIPGEDIRRVNGELSSFSCPTNTPVWFFERPNDWKLKTYAGEWTRTRSDSLHQVSPTGPVQGPVLVYELNQGGYMAITEAALYNYSGMRLKAKKDASLQADFTEMNGFDVAGEIITPWRVILLADNLNGLVNSDLIPNLNPAPDKDLFVETNWIKPGRSVWSWWSEPKGFMTMELEKHFVDRAAELGFEYTTIDEGWERWNDKWQTLKEFCAYAHTRKVDVFVWKHSDQLNFPQNDYQTMRLFFDSLKIAGVNGVKIDFMNGESKALIDFDIRVLQLAAERKMLVNFHGCQKPSGEYRTYPNEITREGIRGLELNKMNQPIPANHNVALVFTRGILNNSDYTPIGFSRPANTTWTHQLATAYAFTSPLVTVAEHPDTLLNNPDLAPAIPFIKTLPSVWDETVVLDGSSIAETAILARRSGNDWYLVVLNGKMSKTIEVQLDFLKKGKWNMQAVKDVKGEQRKMNVEKKTVTSGQKISIELNSEGAYLAKFTK